ncbi:MAG TPA: helix-turn-helix transcriptional regulator [Candidatus Scybalocola faecipullorum]|nr:helix-turn-helix transcriptional regulator [Candidatus Scybalocola faecipullorum]
MDIVSKLRKLCSERGWTEYRLAKESHIAQSTISNLIHRGNSPTILTIEKICQAFGITVSEFFDDGSDILINDNTKRLVKIYDQLNDTQKESLLIYAGNLLARKGGENH